MAGMFGPNVGVWRLNLEPKPAGGPYNMTKTCNTTGEVKKIQVTDVLFGDVWLCSGQSNMAFRVSEVGVEGLLKILDCRCFA